MKNACQGENFKIIGHQKQWQFLRKLAELKKIPHAFLFSGPNQIGKKTLALEFFKLLNCQKKDFKTGPCQICRSCRDIQKKAHPDVIMLEPEEPAFAKTSAGKKEIHISQIRKLKSYLALKSHSAFFKTVIIDQAHSLNLKAQSAFLKLLEEPKGETIFILVTEYPEMLLGTILSRCEDLKFYLVSDKEIRDFLKNQKIPEKEKEKLVSISFGKPGRLLDFLRDPKKREFQEETIKEIIKLINSPFSLRFQYIKEITEDPKNLKEILEIWLRYFRDILMLKINSPDQTSKSKQDYSITKLKEIIKNIQTTNYLISTTNINSKLALEILMMEL